MSEGAVAAVDLGATSGRVVVGRVRADRLELVDVHRFPNHPVRTRDGLHWNLLELYRNVLIGLREATRLEPGLLSVGIDSWAVDYGLVRDGRLLGEPYHYRDERTSQGVRLVHAVATPAELYAANGLQFLPFNTLYQLAIDRAEGLLDHATGMLLIPDLIAYWLTGERRAEVTNASTTGLLDVQTRDWNRDLAERLGLPGSLLPPLVQPGEVVGTVTDDVAVAGLFPVGLPVVAVGSHDTASAVAAVPLTTPSLAYICSGTWSLIGIETDGPILSEEARSANFTNEGGVDGRNRFLRNVMGMWLVNECLASWQLEDPAVDLAELVRAATSVDRWVEFDVTDTRLLPAGDMPARLISVAPPLRGLPPTTVLRSIFESLATAYAATLSDLGRVSGAHVDGVCIVGGASQNALLCQLIADHVGLPVQAGPVEATATGNVLVQARAAGIISGSLENLRLLVRQSAPPVVYRPKARPGGSRCL